MAEKEETATEAESGGSNKKLIIIMVVAILVTAGMSIGVTMMLLGGGGGGDSTEAAPPPEDPLYVPIKVMNINMPPESTAKVMQIEINLMTYQPETVEMINRHMPVIRSEMLNILSEVTYQRAATPQGKEKIKSDLKFAIEAMLLELEGNIMANSGDTKGVPPTLEAVYFTRLVMQ
ncbi:hypothetical protein D5085_08640 [Ectothiorhodospiraceae bacterium BW-2]|nr:hypothetical protein D5085_08640 [Ectothiorhodospiraceae bacterium BW-2]